MNVRTPTEAKALNGHPSRLLRLSVVLTLIWTVAVVSSLVWNYRNEAHSVDGMARQQALAGFNKDVIYRYWNAGHGGVYVPVSESTKPNPYLADVEEREIETPSGRRLTLMNPAYMTRQVHELGLIHFGARGHITSLKPIRPENAPDPWETEALKAFERGEDEAISKVTIDDEPYLRLMRPLSTDEGCLKCHAQQGYRLNDVRGGISIAVPMKPYLAISRKRVGNLMLAHGGLWSLGMVGILLGTRGLLRNERARDRSEAALATRNADLEKALVEIRTLRGIVPICAHCKKVRDDEGFWHLVEVYVSTRTEAEFSHGLCPACEHELYPDIPKRDEASDQDPV